MLLMTEGFDNGDAMLKGWSITDPTSTDNYPRFIYDASTPFGAGKSLRMKTNTSGGSNADARYTGVLANNLPTNKLTVGFWFRRGVPIASGGGEEGYAFYAFDGGSLSYLQGLNITVNSLTGQLKAYKNGLATLLGTSTVAVPQNVWTFIEVTWQFATAGLFQVRQNGTKTIDFSGDTRTPNARTTTAAFGFSGPYAAYRSSFWYDDVYLLDDTGTVNNAPLGAVRVQTLRPVAAGTDTQLTPVGSASNYANAADNPYEPSRFNYGATVGNRDTYALADLDAATTTVYGVRTCLIAAAGAGGVANPAATDGIANAPDLSNGGVLLSGVATWDATAATTETGEGNLVSNAVWHKLFVTAAATLTVRHDSNDYGYTYLYVYTGPANASYAQLSVAGNSNTRDAYSKASQTVNVPANTWVYIASSGPGLTYLKNQHLIWQLGTINNAGLRAAVRAGGSLYYDPAGAFGPIPSAAVAVRETSPATGAAWTVANVNALEAGAEVA